MRVELNDGPITPKSEEPGGRSYRYPALSDRLDLLLHSLREESGRAQAQDVLEFAVLVTACDLKKQKEHLHLVAAVLVDFLNRYQEVPVVSSWIVEALVSVHEGTRGNELSVPLFSALAELLKHGFPDRLLAALSTVAVPDCEVGTAFVDRILLKLETVDRPLQLQRLLALLCVAQSPHRLQEQIQSTLAVTRRLKSDVHLAVRALVTVGDLYELAGSPQDAYTSERTAREGFAHVLSASPADIRLLASLADLHPRNRKIAGAAVRALSSLCFSRVEVQAVLVGELRVLDAAQRAHMSSRSVNLHISRIVQVAAARYLELVGEGALCLVVRSLQAFREDAAIVTNCVRVLSMVAHSHSSTIIEVIEILVATGEGHSGDPDVAYHMCCMVGNLAQNSTVQAECVNACAVVVPLRSLASRTCDARTAARAADAVRRLCFQAPLALAHVGAVNGARLLLHALGRHATEPGVVHAVLAAMAVVAKEPTIRRQLVRSDDIESWGVLDAVLRAAAATAVHDVDIIAQACCALGAITSSEDQESQVLLRCAIDRELLQDVVARVQESAVFPGMDYCEDLINRAAGSWFEGRLLSETGVVCIADKHTQHAQMDTRVGLGPMQDRGPVSRDDVALVAPPISSTDALLRSAPERVSTVGISSGLQNWRLGLRGTAETDAVLPSVADVGPRETALDGLPSERETLIERTPEVSLGGGLVEIATALGLLPERRKPRRGRGTPPRLRVEKSEDAQQTIDPNAVEPPSLQVALKNSDWFAVPGDPVAMPTRWRASKSVDRPHGPPPSIGDVQVHTGAEVAPLTCSTAGMSVAASHRPQPALTDPTLRPSPQFGVESHPLIAAVEPRPSIPHDEPRQRSSESLEGCSSERDRQQSSEPKSRHASVVLKPDSAQHVVARRSFHSQAESHGSETDGSETDGSETDGSESDGSETEGSETDGSNSQNSDELARATTSTRPASLSPTQGALREEPRRASHQTGSRGPDKRGATLTALVGSTQDPPPQEHSAEHLRIPVDANSPFVQRTKPQVNHEVVTSSVAASVGARRQTASPSQGDTPLPSVTTLRTHRTAEVPAQSGRDSTHRSVTPHTLRVQRAAEVAGQPGRASTHRSVTPPTLRVHRAAEVVAHPGLGLVRRSVTPPTLHVHRAAEIAAQPRRVSTHRSVTPPSRRAHKQSSVAGQPGRESTRRSVTPPHKKRDKTRQGTASSAGREEPEVDMMADIASSVWDFMGFGAQEPSREKASSRSASRHKHRDKKAHRSRTPTDR